MSTSSTSTDSGSSATVPVVWWSKPPVVSSPNDSPSPRQGSASVWCVGSTWLFGGVDDRGQFLNDLYRLDFVHEQQQQQQQQQTQQGAGVRWTRVECAGDIPSGRAGHALIVLGRHTGSVPLSLHGHSLPVTKVDKLLLIGGLGAQGPAPSDLFVLDLAAQPQPRWHRVQPSGPDVPPRHHFQSQVLSLVDGSRPRFFVQGGWGADKEKLADMFQLDLATWTWERSDLHVHESADYPDLMLGRAGGGAVADRSGIQFYLFNGEGTNEKPRNDCLTMKVGETFSPVCDAYPTIVRSTSSLPATRSYAQLVTIRCDGRVLVREEASNTLASGAAQSHLGAHPLTTDQDLEAKKVGAASNSSSYSSSSSSSSSASVQPGASPNSPGIIIGQPSKVVPFTRRSSTSELIHRAEQYSFLLGGCDSLKSELRYRDVWQLEVDEQGVMKYEVLHDGGSSNGRQHLLGRADFAVSVLPSDAELGLTAEGQTGEGVSFRNSCIGRVIVMCGNLGGGCTNDVQMLEVFLAPASYRAQSFTAPPEVSNPNNYAVHLAAQSNGQPGSEQPGAKKKKKDCVIQ